MARLPSHLVQAAHSKLNEGNAEVSNDGSTSGKRGTACAIEIVGKRGTNARDRGWRDGWMMSIAIGGLRAFVVWGRRSGCK